MNLLLLFNALALIFANITLYISIKKTYLYWRLIFFFLILNFSSFRSIILSFMQNRSSDYSLGYRFCKPLAILTINSHFSLALGIVFLLGVTLYSVVSNLQFGSMNKTFKVGTFSLIVILLVIDIYYYMNGPFTKYSYYKICYLNGPSAKRVILLGTYSTIICLIFDLLFFIHLKVSRTLSERRKKLLYSAICYSLIPIMSSLVFLFAYLFNFRLPVFLQWNTPIVFCIVIALFERRVVQEKVEVPIRTLLSSNKARKVFSDYCDRKGFRKEYALISAHSKVVRGEKESLLDDGWLLESVEIIPNEISEGSENSLLQKIEKSLNLPIKEFYKTNSFANISYLFEEKTLLEENIFDIE